MYFQGFSAWFLRFRAHGTGCLLFRGMSSWSKCMSLFWRRHVALVKLLLLIKSVFKAINQIYFQSSQWFILFKFYDTRYRYFCNIKLKQMQIKVLKQWLDLSKTAIFLKPIFHCYYLNVFSRLLWMYCIF